MVDEALRALTRAAQLGGAAERLACAHALERAGRRDDALDVLVPSRAASEVRRELARFPCWSQESGTAGATHDVDTAPLLDPPAVLWRSALLPEPRPEPRLGSWRLIAATPTAIVVYRTKHLAALDPETGETLWVRTGLRMTASSRVDRPFVAGDALVRGHWYRVSWFDVRTGDLLREQPLRGACLRGEGDASATDLVLVPHRRSDDPVLLSSFVVPSAEPRLARRWSHELGDLPFQPDDVVLSDLQAVLTTDRPGAGPDLLALDRASGALRWARHSGCWRAAVDERRVIAHGETHLLSLAPDGELRWRTDVTRTSSVVLTPERVVVLTGGHSPRLRFHDRASGAVLAERHWRGGALTAARGVVYGVDSITAPTLACLSPTGDLLWSVDVRDLAQDAFVGPVLPLRRRLYAVTERHPDRRARVVCLGAQGT